MTQFVDTMLFSDGEAYVPLEDGTWDDILKDDLEERIQALKRGETMVFARMIEDTDYQDDDGIFMWVKQYDRECRDLVNCYRRKYNRPAYFYAEAKRKGLDMQRFERVVEGMNYPWALAMSNEAREEAREFFNVKWAGGEDYVRLAHGLLVNRIEYQEAAKTLRKAMQDHDFLSMLCTKEDTIFTYRTRVIEQIESARDYWQSLDNGCAGYCGVVVYRVGRNWMGELIEVDQDSCWGFYVNGCDGGESMKYIYSQMTDMTPDEKPMPSPLQMYLDTFDA
jgi:hypothetical protein